IADLGNTQGVALVSALQSVLAAQSMTLAIGQKALPERPNKKGETLPARPANVVPVSAIVALNKRFDTQRRRLRWTGSPSGAAAAGVQLSPSTPGARHDRGVRGWRIAGQNRLWPDDHCQRRRGGGVPGAGGAGAAGRRHRGRGGQRQLQLAVFLS